MAHFAQLDENNIVTQVIVVSNDDTSDVNGNEVEEIGVAFCKKLLGANTNWKQTSYNNSIRKRYAGKGMIYDEGLDAFLSPQPFPSWSLNTETVEWEPPIPMPEVPEGSFGYYTWNEESLLWDFVEITLPEEPAEEETLPE